MPPSNNSNKIFLVILAISVSIVMFNFSRTSSTNQAIYETLHEIDDKKTTLENYEKFEEMSKYIIKGFGDTFNGGSSGIKSTDGFLILKPNGDSDKIVIKRASSSDRCSYRLLSASLDDSKYGTRICSDLKVEVLGDGGFDKNNEVLVRVTTGAQTGYNIIKLINEKRNESAYVLVLVANQ